MPCTIAPASAKSRNESTSGKPGDVDRPAERRGAERHEEQREQQRRHDDASAGERPRGSPVSTSRRSGRPSTGRTAGRRRRASGVTVGSVGGPVARRWRRRRTRRRDPASAPSSRYPVASANTSSRLGSWSSRCRTGMPASSRRRTTCETAPAPAGQTDAEGSLGGRAELAELGAGASVAGLGLVGRRRRRTASGSRPRLRARRVGPCGRSRRGR